jgi:uncharacterized protein
MLQERGRDCRFDAIEFLDHLPVARVQRIHLAGHSDHGDSIVDTHDHPVAEPVWQLYRHTWAHFGAVATMIERDDDIPELGVLIAELNRARTIAADALATGMPEEQEKVS